ncbi:hypothetical protein LCGC14_0612720 [marine sediment metagenome]|uniref:Uncharacterized protein n=1 Tax=marine sediment metagenome TaxID=412755 RepID=A0A0F9UFP9_9ZZZZ
MRLGTRETGSDSKLRVVRWMGRERFTVPGPQFTVEKTAKKGGPGMKIFRIEDFSDSEIEEVKSVLAERLKDLIFMNVKEKVGEVIEELKSTGLSEIDTINIKYTFELIGGDILQIVGRVRRKAIEEDPK